MTFAICRSDLLPKITIVTPSYNQARFLETALRSVLFQDYPHLEHIVIDGGSTDGSVEILRRYEDRFAYWRSEPDEGQSGALRRGFAMATGEILAWINSDDSLEPGALATVGEYFSLHPETDLVYGNMNFIDAEGKRLFTAYPVLDPRILLYDNGFIPQQAMFWRRGLYERAGGVDPTLRFVMDFDLTLRFFREGAKVAKVDRILANFRFHPDAKSSTIRDVMRQEEKVVVARLFPGLEDGFASRLAKKWIYRGMRYLKEPRGILTAIIARGGPKTTSRG